MLDWLRKLLGPDQDTLKSIDEAWEAVADAQEQHRHTQRRLDSSIEAQRLLHEDLDGARQQLDNARRAYEREFHAKHGMSVIECRVVPGTPAYVVTPEPVTLKMFNPTSRLDEPAVTTKRIELKTVSANVTLGVHDGVKRLPAISIADHVLEVIRPFVIDLVARELEQ